MSRFAGRSCDRVYFLFLVSHIPATLMMDAQAVYPKWLVPGALESFGKWYIGLFRDPVMTGVLTRDGSMDFMMPFFYLEVVFQLPCFVLGAMGLWRSRNALGETERSVLTDQAPISRGLSLTQDDKRVWPLLVAYGASTATTLLPVLQSLLWDTNTSPPLTTFELASLLSCYIPYLVVPLMMAVDLGLRLTKLIGGGVRKKV
ncbi:hypothetical protein CC85DRAFT_288244 [Cutaneotrichosporon oleaginosum]|uniref:EXPERA domain-containing protein n=1 Tax=Cutaneotrichosporon oleaginosum TaxID=879819 RepID=A0A0J1AWT3_9TREE|nr:uncharacterized protein CC85DRAFT_288244 [Cutaneotrichosporon oleaginosum]KLT39754.1 hypothetical protein CC85DRAFT_288244 [Cutaneotrichosporon oleaginosum]TXT12236.1 hypothetical protein COLE_02646 [Cutaneotrichosporon oleaginosum]